MVFFTESGVKPLPLGMGIYAVSACFLLKLELLFDFVLLIWYHNTGGASCEIGNTDFHLQPKGIFGCICKLTKLSGETPPGKA